MKLRSGGRTQACGLEVGPGKESGLRGALAGQGLDKRDASCGQGRRDTELEDLTPTAGVEAEGFDGTCG